MALACQLYSSVAFWGEGSEKGQWPLPAFLSGRKMYPCSRLDAGHFSFSLYAIDAFPAATLVLELRGSEWVWVSLCRFFKKNCLGPGWYISVDWAQAYKPKNCWFDSQSVHMPGLQARSPVGGAQEATTHWCFSPSLFPSPPVSLKLNK